MNALTMRTDEQFEEGGFVMIHPGAMLTSPPRPHPDAGRIGRIKALDAYNLMVCFRDHPSRRRQTHCILPRGAWVKINTAPAHTLESDGAVTWGKGRA